MLEDILFALKRKCPVCRTGELFASRFSLQPKETCDICDTPLRKQDVGDGAAVFLTFLLGFTIIPAALVWDAVSSPPMWLQAIVWTVVMIVVIFGITPSLKAYIMLLQYRHRKSEWETLEKSKRKKD